MGRPLLVMGSVVLILWLIVLMVNAQDKRTRSPLVKDFFNPKD